MRHMPVHDTPQTLDRVQMRCTRRQEVQFQATFRAFQPMFQHFRMVVSGVVKDQVDSAGLGPSLLDVLEQIQRCLGIDTLALHANQPHFLKVQGGVDVQALPARRCLDRRPVVLSEPSMGWSGLVLGVYRIDEDPLLVRRQAVHKAFILRNKILLRRWVSMLWQPLRPPPVEAETVHQLDRSRMRVLNPEGLSQPRPHPLRVARRLRPEMLLRLRRLRGRQMTLTLRILGQIQRCHSLLLEVAAPAAHRVGIQEQDIGNKRRRMALVEEKMRVGSAYFQSFGIVLPEYRLQLRMLADS